MVSVEVAPNSVYMWYPVLVPQIEGGFTPVCPSAVNLSVQMPTAAVNPDMVWKSNLSWQMSSEHLDTLISQLPVEVGVKELGKFGFLI